jgi:hypothetical protein
MLNCRDFAEQADALIDEELGPWQAMRLRLHLTACKGCARFFEQLRATRRLSEAEGADQTGPTASEQKPRRLNGAPEIEGLSNEQYQGRPHGRFHRDHRSVGSDDRQDNDGRDART